MPLFNEGNTKNLWPSKHNLTNIYNTNTNKKH